MDQIGDYTSFSFQWLLYGDDWERWDTYPTVDANAISPDSTVEMNRDGPTIEPRPLVTTPRWEQSFEQWFESFVNESVRSAQEEDILFEELLIFMEEIGEDHTGLNIGTIDENLNRRKYENWCSQTEKCVICLENLKYNEEVSKLRCGHDFHFDCIKQWLMVKNMCPLCRQKVI